MIGIFESKINDSKLDQNPLSSANTISQSSISSTLFPYNACDCVASLTVAINSLPLLPCPAINSVINAYHESPICHGESH